LFACGTAAVVAGVGRLRNGDDSVTLAEGPELGPTTTEIRQRLLDIQYGVRPDPHDWLHRWH
jgi:branched-chain amino acid aminotransferase